MPIAEIAQAFGSPVISIEPLGNGFINDTFKVDTQTEAFVLQKVNRRVFRKPEQIMVNLELLSRHAGKQAQNGIRLRIPGLLKTSSGRSFIIDGNGDYWRAWEYIANTESPEAVSDLRQAREAGSALGQFHRMTQTLDADSLYDTLPGFHITPRYFDAYLHIKNQTEVPGNNQCEEFIERNRHIIHDLEYAKAQGLLKVRTIHGDPKLNNFLFDKTTWRIVSLIDLDTVKPGLIHYDIGDCLRSCCHNLETNEFNLELCREVLTGYLQEMGNSFTGEDYRLLYPCIRLIPFELGLRFYTDYLNGNPYFKITEPDDNLNRAKAQFGLCESVIKQEANIEKMIFSLKTTLQN